MKGLLLEVKKTKSSKILLVFILMALVIWAPSYFNASISFDYLAARQLTITAPDYFFVQGMMAVAWFLFPASIVVASLMLMSIETANKGLLKMKTLPINLSTMNINKFMVLLLMAFVQIILIVIMYAIVAGVVSIQLDDKFFASISLVLKMGLTLFLSSMPMISFFWMVTTSVPSKIISLAINVLALVPSVILINLDIWYLYPICYPYYFMVKTYELISGDLSIPAFELFPWIIVAIVFTVVCLLISNYAFTRRKEQ